MFGLRRSSMVLTVVVVAALTSMATAYAYWTADGSGTGTATVAQVWPLAVTQVAVTGLVPGQAQPLHGTVHNPNNFDVNIADKLFTVTAAVDPSSLNGEFARNFELTSPTSSGLVAPANGEVSFSAGSIELLNVPGVDQSVWQGAVITLSYTLSQK